MKNAPTAVSAKIAAAATGLARSSKPGRMERKTVSQTALRGVLVMVDMCPKNPLSGNPWSREKA